MRLTNSTLLATSFAILLLSGTGCETNKPIASKNLGGQVHFRGGYSHLAGDRGGEIFTDSLALGGANDSQDGFHLGAGLDVPLLTDPFDNTLLGEIDLNYFQFSRQDVLVLTDVVTDSLGVTPAPFKTDEVTVNEMTITVAPKYRFDSFGQLRPWIIPAGLAFLVQSPPSDNTTYLDVGMTFGGGAELKLNDIMSVGADARYTIGFGAADTENDVFSTGGYLGINF